MCVPEREEKSDVSTRQSRCNLIHITAFTPRLWTSGIGFYVL
jgi:hypothetical protein